MPGSSAVAAAKEFLTVALNGLKLTKVKADINNAHVRLASMAPEPEPTTKVAMARLQEALKEVDAVSRGQLVSYMGIHGGLFSVLRMLCLLEL